MIALLIVLELFSIAAHLATPAMTSARLRGKSAAIAREMLQVRQAAVQARQKSGSWPPGANPGTVPSELSAYLPAGFTFAHEGYQLRWESWELTDESVLVAPEQSLAGVTVITRDPRLAALVARQIKPGELRLTLDNQTTLVLDSGTITTP